jgi:acetyl-CoA carboxylase biotin carboxyl carrier protein
MAKAPTASKDASFDTDLVRKLAKLIGETDLSEIEIENGEMRIRVARNVTANVTVAAAPAPVVAAAPPVAVPSSVAAPSKSEPASGTVPSPMVGTAYLRPAPGAKAFVEVGAKVAVGDKVLLVEAMKTFNDIVAPHAGTVTAILVEDGQPVEFGQPLLVIS